MSQIQWTVSLVMIGLFAVAVIGFATNFAIDNDAVVSLADDQEISTLYAQTGGNLSGFNTGAEDTYASIINSSISPTATSGTTTTAGQFSITPINMIAITTNILRVGYSKIFGSDSGFNIFITTLIGMIIFITGLLIWKTWAGRQPD